MEMELTLALPQAHAVSERRKTETSSSLAKGWLCSEVAAARLCALLPKLIDRTAAIVTQRTVPTSESGPLTEPSLETWREMRENFFFIAAMSTSRREGMPICELGGLALQEPVPLCGTHCE